jgi:hypothetical protein
MVGIASTLNSELFWLKLGRETTILLSSILLATSIAFFLVRSRCRIGLHVNPLGVLSALLAIIVIYLSFYTLVTSASNSLFLAKAVFSVGIIALFSRIRLRSAQVSQLVFGYFCSVWTMLIVVLMFEGDVDSSGNIASLALMCSFLVYFLVSKKFGLVSVIGLALITLAEEARTGTVLACAALGLFLLHELKNALPSIRLNNSVLGANAIAKYLVLVGLVTAYSLIIVVATDYNLDSRLNTMLTYRPIIWGVAWHSGIHTDNWLVPAELVQDVYLSTGEAVYSYYGWASETKSYSPHNFLLGNLVRWGPFGATLIVATFLVLYIKSKPFWGWSSIALALLNGLGATTLIGTSNMFGVYLLVLAIVMEEAASPLPAAETATIGRSRIHPRQFADGKL